MGTVARKKCNALQRPWLAAMQPQNLLAGCAALILGCSFAVPVSAETTYDVTMQEERESDIIGPFKVIYLAEGDSYNWYEDGQLAYKEVVTGNILENADVRYYAVQPAIDFFAQALGEKDAAGNIPAEGSITYYIGMLPMDLSVAATASYNGAVSDIYQKLVTPGTAEQNSRVSMNFNSSIPIYIWDYPRAVSLENSSNALRTAMHEFTHSLGMADTLIGLETGEYYWGANINSYSKGLHDIYGNQAQAGQEVVLIGDGNMPDPRDGKFYLCRPDAANYKDPIFHGTHVDALTNNQGIPVLGALNRVVNGQQEDLLINGSSLSHVNSFVSYMNYGSYGGNTMVTELDLAMLQDIGYEIDRSKYFGKSYLPYNGSEGETLSGIGFTGEQSRSFVTGAHIYRNGLSLNQDADIRVDGAYGAGAIISGKGNTLNVGENTQINADGFAGTGIGVNYGSNNTINIQGTVTALGEQGIGLLVNSDCENYFSKETYYASRAETYLPEGQVDEDVIYKWQEMGENNGGSRAVIEKAINDNHGYSVDNLNVTGTLAGKWASIYIGPYNYIHNINVSGNGKLVGDILFGGHPVWNYTQVMAGDNVAEADKHYMDTHLNYGMDAFGNIDADYRGSFSGNISTPWNYGEGSDPLDTGRAFVYLNHKGGVLDLNKDKKQNEAAVAVLSFANEENTITNLGGTLNLWSMGYGYPHEKPGEVGVVNIKGMLRPGGEGYADICITADEYKHGENGRLQLDFDMNTLEHDRIAFYSRKINGNYKAMNVQLGKIDFVEQNPYHGAPAMLTREDFFGLGEATQLDDSKVQAAVLTKDEAYGTGRSTRAAAAAVSGTGVADMGGTWAVYSLGSGFAANMEDSGRAKAVAGLLDQKAADMAAASLSERQLLGGFMREPDTGRWAEYANQLATDAYAQQLGAAMHVNHWLSGEIRRDIFNMAPLEGDGWRLSAKPFAFRNEWQGAHGSQQNGNGFLLGADRQFGSTGLSIFCGYLHDDTDMAGETPLRSKREGGFAGISFQQAKDAKNGPFFYGFARYDDSRVDNERQVAVGTYGAVNKGSFRQQGGAAELGLGWRQTNARGTLLLHSGINYALAGQSAFGENADSASAVHQPANSYRSLLGSAGVQYTTAMMPLNQVTDYQVSASATWNQELHRRSLDYNAGLLGGNVPVHWENQEDKGWMELNVQGKLRYKENLTVTAALGTELFRKNHHGISGSLQLNYEF